jgi:drug/metabolite transporter (DMT)-like permease
LVEQAEPLGHTRAAVSPATRYGVLLVGIAAVSTSSVLIRLADAPALVIGAWRLLLATLLLTPWAWPAARREWPALTRRQIGALLGASVALAAHFGAWIYAVQLTTVASATVLVATNPIFVGLATHFLLRRPVERRMALAIAITVAGSMVIGYGDIGLSGRALLGDAMALLAAVGSSAYILLGSVVRERLSTLAYVWPCYGLAGLILLGVCLVAGQPLGGYPPATYAVLVALAVVPQILGHSAFNWALGHLSTLLVTVALLGEPVGATLLAWLMLGETPPVTAYLGGPLILAGILLASWVESTHAHA